MTVDHGNCPICGKPNIALLLRWGCPDHPPPSPINPIGQWIARRIQTAKTRSTGEIWFACVAILWGGFFTARGTTHMWDGTGWADPWRFFHAMQNLVFSVHGCLALTAFAIAAYLLFVEKKGF